MMAQKLKTEINTELETTAKKLLSEENIIPAERQKELKKIADFLLIKSQEVESFNLLFVCTHNSRRSHIADTWFKFGTLYFDLDEYHSYSGGTEESAFNPNAVEALKRAGFSANFNSEINNPVVSISPGRYPVWKMKSKKYSHELNPKSNFIAIMVCSEADKSCPYVEGAEGRFAIPYNDPRYYDDSPSQNMKYDETVDTIGRELLFLTNYLKQQKVLSLENKK